MADEPGEVITLDTRQPLRLNVTDSTALSDYKNQLIERRGRAVEQVKAALKKVPGLVEVIRSAGSPDL